MCGIYGCTAKFVDNKVIFTSQCWSWVSFAATAEWTLSVLWMIFISTVAYDNYYLEDTVQQLLTTPPPLNPKGSGLAFWKRWRKTGQAEHGLEDGNGRLEAMRTPARERVVEQSVRDHSGRNSFAESMDDRRVEEYSPLEHQGQTWLPSITSMTAPGSTNRGYQHVSHSPNLENS